MMFPFTRMWQSNEEVSSTPADSARKKEESPEIVERTLLDDKPQPSATSSTDDREDESSEDDVLLLKVDKARGDAKDSKHRSERGNSHSGKHHRDHAVKPYEADLARKLRKSQREAQELERKLVELHRTLINERLEHQSTKKQLAEKSAELQAANVFLSQADSFSCADVVKMTEIVNFDIEQISARVASYCGEFGSLSLKEAFARNGHEEILQAQQEINRLMGANLGEAMDSPAIRNDEGVRGAWIQYTLQACIVKFLHREFDKKWSEHPDLESTLQYVYNKLTHQDCVFRPVAGRWRTLTHAVCQEPVSVQNLAEQVLLHSRQVLIAFGCIETTPVGDFVDDFRSDMESIIANLVNLDVVMKQKISSLRLSLGIARPGSPFDPTTMIDTESPDHGSGRDDGERIFASVSLGLAKASNTDDTIEVLLKINVVLESLLRSMGKDGTVEEIL